MTPLRIFIGHDRREPIALQVCMHSILRHASGPVAIVPLVLANLQGIYTRPPNGTTDFSLTRFLVPYLSGYQGVSIFLDCDMLVQCDIYEVLRGPYFDLSEDAPVKTFEITDRAVSCCQHVYVPKAVDKATGAQTTYPRKNWSSFMVFNNAKCRTLTPEYVNNASPADLHRMVWAKKQIGALPLDFNWLVGEYAPLPDARILHYTLGTPCFHDYRNCDQSDLWFAELEAMGQPLDLSWLGRQKAKYAAMAGR